MLDQSEIQQISQRNAQQRYEYWLEQVRKHQQIWILSDQDGCVMLNDQDEDFVPVWPGEAFAAEWASDEWAGCQPQAISLQNWLSRWSPGLSDDDIAVAVFPNQHEEGVVLYPEDLADMLRDNTRQ